MSRPRYVGQGARTRARVRTRCECALWRGTDKRCAWIGPESDTVVVAFVPRAVRSAFAALPEGKRELVSKRVRVCRECVFEWLEADAPWAWLSEDEP